jgi:hypothetical protein
MPKPAISSNHLDPERGPRTDHNPLSTRPAHPILFRDLAASPQQRFAHSDLRSRSSEAASSMSSQLHHQTTAGTPPSLSTFACKECATECKQPSCPAVELTDQCTDQCVVIACHDMTHGELPCSGIGTGVDQQCDLVCDGIADCVDCTGYEDLVSRPHFSAVLFAR